MRLRIIGSPGEGSDWQAEPLTRFLSDKPLRPGAPDDLQRASFVDALAASLKNWKDKDSLVISIEGAWGSGKTTLVERALLQLFPQGTKGKVVRFNPWEWANHVDLLEAFVKSVREAIDLPNKSAAETRLLETFRAWEFSLDLARPLFEPLQKLAGGLLALAGAQVLILATATVLAIPPDVSFAIAVVSLVLYFLCSAAIWFPGTAVKVLERRSKKAPVLPEDARSALSAELLKRNDPLVIVIDDLDRLSAKQVQTVFQLVKANADLSNVIYVLLFDRTAIRNLLKQDGIREGDDFIEKIVQISLPVPKVDAELLENFLMRSIVSVFPEPDVIEAFQTGYWIDLLARGLRDLFRTPRSIVRFTNILRFRALALGGKREEVFIPDLIVLEAIRMVAPDAYDLISRSKKYVTYHMDFRDFDFDRDEVRQQFLQEVLGLVPLQFQDPVNLLVRSIFPALVANSGGPHVQQPKTHSLRRIKDTFAFDTYFLFKPSVSHLSEQEIRSFIEGMVNGNNVGASITRLACEGRLGIMAGSIQQRLDLVPRDVASSFTQSYFSMCDAAVNRSPAETVHSHYEMARTIRALLKRDYPKDRRLDVLSSCFNGGTGLLGPLAMDSVLKGDLIDGDHENALLSPLDHSKYREMCAAAIAKVASEHDLISYPNFPYIMNKWADVVTGDLEPKAWLADHTQTEEGMAKAIAAFAYYNLNPSQEGYAADMQLNITLDGPERFIGINKAYDLLNTAKAESLDKEVQRRVTLFLEAVKSLRANRLSGLNYPFPESGVGEYGEID